MAKYKFVPRAELTEEDKPLVTGRAVDPVSGFNYWIVQSFEKEPEPSASEDKTFQDAALDGWT